MGPLFPLTVTKEKHIIAHAVLEDEGFLFVFTFSRTGVGAVDPSSLLAGTAEPGEGHIRWTLTHYVPLKPLNAADSGVLVFSIPWLGGTAGWRLPKVQVFPSLSLVWSVSCRLLGEDDNAQLMLCR